MEPNSREFYKQCAFQKFCNTVLHNEACDTHRELRRHKAKEVTFSDMTLDEARQLHTFDEYFKREAAETVFEKAGKKITPKLLLEAIRTLPEEKRKAIGCNEQFDTCLRLKEILPLLSDDSIKESAITARIKIENISPAKFPIFFDLLRRQAVT